jgi:hypothetical protein
MDPLLSVCAAKSFSLPHFPLARLEKLGVEASARNLSTLDFAVNFSCY